MQRNYELPLGIRGHSDDLSQLCWFEPQLLEKEDDCSGLKYIIYDSKKVRI